MRVILSEAKPPRQVAPSPPRYACHLSRFNGRAYSRKGGFPRSIYNHVFARPLAGRGNLRQGRPLSVVLRTPPLPLQRESIPEDRSVSDYASRSAHYCGVDVPDETGKMSRSDKRGATLPKVATVVSLLRNDGVVLYRGSAEEFPGRAVCREVNSRT